MSVDLYIGCRACKCAVHTQLNARHELAESLLGLRWTSEFGARALPWLREHPDFGPRHEVSEALGSFCALHEGHPLGIVGDDDIGRWPWRREDLPLPGLAGLGARTKGAREQAARLARFAGDPAACEPLLLALVQDRAQSVRVEAARSLASLANAQELRGPALARRQAALAAALSDERPAVRCGALEALGWLASGCPEDPLVYFEPVCERSADERASVAELLLVAIEDAEALEDKAAMEQGLRSLTFTRDPGALEVALPLLADDEARVRAAAIATLRAASQEGGLGAAAEDLAQAAEASLLAAAEGSPRAQAERQWGEILASVGALEPLKELFRRRGWFAQALQQATVGLPQPGRWPLERQTGPQPVARRDLPQAGEELWERPEPLGAHRQPCLSEVDARGDLVAAASESGLALLYRLSSGARRELVHVSPERRDEELRALALSPEGALLATGDSVGAVKVWDCASGERVGGFYCGEPVTRLRWFPQDEWLLVAGETSLEVRERGGELVQAFPLGHSGAVLEARLDPSGEWLATRGSTRASRGDAAVHVYSLETGQPWTTIEGPRPAAGLRWSPCGQRLAILDDQRDLRVYDLASGQVLASLRADYPQQDFALLREGVLFAKQGPTWVDLSGQVERRLEVKGEALALGPEGAVAFAGGDGTLHVVRGEEARPLEHPQAAKGQPAVAWAGDTIAAVFGSSQPAKVLLLSADGAERGCFTGERSPKALALSPDEGLLALLCQRHVQVFDLASGGLLWQREGHFYDPVSLEFSPDGAALIYCDKADSVGGRRPGWVEVRDARSGERRGRHGGRSLAGAVDLSPDGKRVAFGGGLLSSRRDLRGHAPSEVVLWDLDECGVAQVLRDEPRRERLHGERCLWVRALAFSPGGDALATSMQGGLTLWDLERGEPRWRNPAWADAFDFVQLRFSLDGALLYAGRDDDVLVVFDAATGQERVVRDRSSERRHPRETALAPLADGRVVVGRRGVELVDPAAAERAERALPPRALEPARLPTSLSPELVGEHASRVQALAWSPEGERFASASDDGSARLCAAGGEALTTLEGLHPPGVSALCFLDSGELVSGGWDGRLRLLGPAGELLRSPIRLEAWVESLHALAGGRRVLSVSRDQQLVLWDLEQGQGEPLLATSAGLACLSPGRERCYGLSRTGALLQPFVTRAASSAATQRGERLKPRLHTFASETLSPLAARELPEPAEGDWRVSALVALGDGERVALARGGRVSWLSLASGEEQRLSDQPASALAAHPSQALLACGDEEGRLRLLDLEGGGLELDAHCGRVEALAWSPGGEALLSGGADGKVLRWRLRA